MTKISFGAVLDDSFGAMKKNFGLLFWTSLVFQVILLVLMIPFIYLAMTGATPDTAGISAMIIMIILILTVGIYFNMFIEGIILHALEDKKVSAQIGMEYAKKYFWKYTGIFLLMILATIILAVPFVLALILAFGSGTYIATNPALGVIGLIFGIILSLALFILMICFVASMIFLMPKAIVEEKSNYMIIKESIMQLMHEPGYIWSTAGIVFAISFCAAIIGLIFDIPFTLSGITIANIQVQSTATITLFILANIVKTIIQVIVAIYFNMFIAKAYIEGHKKEIEAFRWLK